MRNTPLVASTAYLSAPIVTPGSWAHQDSGKMRLRLHATCSFLEEPRCRTIGPPKVAEPFGVASSRTSKYDDQYSIDCQSWPALLQEVERIAFKRY